MKFGVGYDDVDDAVTHVQSRGFRTAVLTNGTRELQEAKLGVLSAAVLETYLLHPSPWLFLGVGLIALGTATRRATRTNP